jgi:hypothetical protein
LRAIENPWVEYNEGTSKYYAGTKQKKFILHFKNQKKYSNSVGELASKYRNKLPVKINSTYSVLVSQICFGSCESLKFHEEISMIQFISECWPSAVK